MGLPIDRLIDRHQRERHSRPHAGDRPSTSRSASRRRSRRRWTSRSRPISSGCCSTPTAATPSAVRALMGGAEAGGRIHDRAAGAGGDPRATSTPSASTKTPARPRWRASIATAASSSIRTRAVGVHAARAALARDPATPVDRAGDRPSRKIPRGGRTRDRPPPRIAAAISPSIESRRERFTRPAQRSRRRWRNSSASARGSRRERAADDLAVGPARRHRREPAICAPPRSACSSPPARATKASDEHGLSHLLEHMAFKGTAERNAREIAEAIENVGGDLNAETGVEQTAYFARVLGEDVDLALDVIADILTDSRFDPDELAREKNVILQEIGAVEDTPDDLVFDLFTAAAWPRQPIGRPILGTRESVGGFDRARDRRLSAPPLSRRRGDRRGGGRGRPRPDRRRAPKRCWRRSAQPRPSRRRRPPIAAARSDREEAARADPHRRRIRGPRDRAPPTTTPRMSSPRRPAAACRRACSRKCGRSAASPIRSIRSTGAFPTAACSASTPARRRQGRRRADRARRARLPRRGRRAARRDGSRPRQGADEGLDPDRARIAARRARSSSRARPSSTARRCRSTTCWRASTAISVDDVRQAGAAMLRSPPTVAAIGGVGKALDAAACR